MRNAFFRSLLFLSVAAAFAIGIPGCSSPTSTSGNSQQIWNIAWLPNEANGMLAYQDQLIENSSNTFDTSDNLYRVNTSGSIGAALNPNNDPAVGNYLNALMVVYVSADGSTAISQFGTDIYSIALGNGNATDLIKNTGLFGVSLDGKYAATCASVSGGSTKYLSIYDLSGNAPTQSSTTNIPGLASNRVLWLNNDDYALTVADSNSYYVAIYNIGGDTVMTIPNATVEFSNSAYAPGSNDLFVETTSQGIDRINLTTKVRTAIVADSIDSMDASSDGTVLVYTSSLSTLTYGTLYAVNLANLHTALVPNATNIVKPVISPLHDWVACAQLMNGSNTNSSVGVFQLTIPQ